jgi:hypothetical protein
MSIGALADALVRRVVPQTRAGACLAPEPCGPCGNATPRICWNGRVATVYYTLKVTNCQGACTINKKTVCRVVYTGGPC